MAYKAKKGKGNYQKKEWDGVKRSGCKYKEIAANGAPCYTGWNKVRSRGYLINAVASPNRDGRVVTNKKGEDSEMWTVKVSWHDGLQSKLYTGFRKIDNNPDNKLVIPDLKMVMNPKTNYFGTVIRRKK